MTPPNRDLTPPDTGFYLLQLAPGQFPAAAALSNAGIRRHLYHEVMLGDETETHATLYAATDLIIPYLDELLLDDGQQVNPDITDPELRAVAQWCANHLNWYDNREVDSAAFRDEFPNLIIAIAK